VGRLYEYAGFSSGDFFSPDGTMLQNCTFREVCLEEKRLGVECQFTDTFVLGSFITVMG
jgi:hypothetical protein